MKGTAVFVSVMAFFLFGCSVIRTTKEEITKTGLFDDDPVKLMDAYEKTQEGQTFEEVMILGFNFNAPNILHRQGSDAVKTILGENMFQSSMVSIMNDPERLRTVLKELGPYHLYVIPYRNITTVTDRFYLNRQDSNKEGKDYKIYFVFKDNKMVYRANDTTNVKQHTSESAFLKGLIDLVAQIAGAKSSVEKVEKKIDKDD